MIINLIAATSTRTGLEATPSSTSAPTPRASATSNWPCPAVNLTSTVPGNAIAESVIATIKTELTKRQLWRSRLEFALPVYSGLYHERRLHRAPGGNTPAETAAAYHRDHANENSTTTEKTS